MNEAQRRAAQVRSTLDGSVLWLRTNETIGFGWIKYAYSALQWLLDVDTWHGVDSAIYQVVQLKLSQLILLTVSLVALLTARPRLKRLLLQRANKVGNVGEDDYWNTPMAFVNSLMLAMPIPLLLVSAFWLVKDVLVNSGSVIPAISASLLATGLGLTVLLFFKALCRQHSVFRSHFSWNDHSVSRLNSHLNWFVWAFALSTSLYTFAITSGRPDLRYAMGVSAFLLISLAMSTLLYALFHPRRGIAFEQDDARNNSALARLGIWILIALPAVLGLLPLMGYFDTAATVQRRLFLTGVLLMSVIIAGNAGQIAVCRNASAGGHRRRPQSTQRA